MGTVTKFVPRLTAPSTTDKYWIKSTKGGLNDCLEIRSGSVLPNCVGYAWGRFYEFTGEKPRLANLNAEDWYGNTSDGYKRSATPKLGAVACWRKGKVWNSTDGCGHVAIVEEIKENGDIVCSNSAYGGTRFYVSTYSKNAGYNSGSLTFQGFILPPVDFDEKAMSTKSIDEIALEVISGIWGNGQERKDKLSAAGYSYSDVQDRVNEILYKDTKTDREIALEVIAGKWGNGDERKKRLTAAGYDYYTVQKLVNEVLYGG